MPTYDYICDKCGKRTEIFQYMSDKLFRKCPSCGKSALRRLIGTGAAVIFKGSGFYETDYKRKPSCQNGGKPDSPKPDSPKPGASKPASD